MHVIGTAGHVDHGKSSLVRALTGFDPDTLEEEKRRGLTIDLGFAWLDLPSGEEAGLIDVPGHERFIRNMLAGAGGVTICLLVVAANEGWSRQSAEHLAIVDLLGIDAGVVALTKRDLVSHSEADEVEEDVQRRLQATTLEKASIVRCSSATGDGIEDVRIALDDAVRSATVPSDVGMPRLWIDRVFTISGSGTVVTGTLAGGSFATGDPVEILPAGHGARIRGIQTHKHDVARAMAGTRVALNLANLGRGRPERGDAVVSPGRWRATGRVDVRVRALRSGAGGPGIASSDRPNHLLYAGSAESLARVKVIGATEIRNGDAGWAQVELRDPLPLARGDRFVLRDAGRAATIGGGWVVDPFPTPARRRDDVARIDRLEMLAVARSSEEAAKTLVELERVIDRTELALRSGAHDLPPGTSRLGPLVASAGELARLQAFVREELARHHAELPLEVGASREALRLATGLPVEAFDALVTTLGDVRSEGQALRLAAHSISFNENEQRARDELLARIERSGYAPPLTDELKTDPRFLDALVAHGDLIKVGAFYLTAAQAEEARRRVRELISSQGPSTVAQIRDALGTTRKYAVPLCEWLDSTGVTRRRGDVRVLV